jgi:hypothetical protein
MHAGPGRPPPDGAGSITGQRCTPPGRCCSTCRSSTARHRQPRSCCRWRPGWRAWPGRCADRSSPTCAARARPAGPRLSARSLRGWRTSAGSSPNTIRASSRWRNWTGACTSSRIWPPWQARSFPGPASRSPWPTGPVVSVRLRASWPRSPSGAGRTRRRASWCSALISRGCPARCPATCPWTLTGGSLRRWPSRLTGSPRTRCCCSGPAGCGSANCSTWNWTACTRCPVRDHG